MTTAPAYDIKPERPMRTEIDPFRTIDALRDGYVMAFRAGYSTDELRERPNQIIWAVIVDAARTERAFPEVRNRGYGGGWPEVVHTPAEVFAARASRLESKMPEYDNPPIRIRPTAAQISRYDEVTVWLRFCHGLDKLQARDILWGRASGTPYGDLKRQTGLSVKRIKNIRCEQLAVILGRIKAELKKYNWEDAVFY